jgi:hypothetical protein
MQCIEALIEREFRQKQADPTSMFLPSHFYQLGKEGMVLLIPDLGMLAAENAKWSL